LSQTLFEERQLEGEGAYRAMRPGLRFSKTPVSIRRDPPSIGRHTDEVLEEAGVVEVMTQA
jgi:crotonobetainyl-CoA:carnitine CoA-transferase CaiB-like acyl-CoA transferase